MNVEIGTFVQYGSSSEEGLLLEDDNTLAKEGKVGKLVTLG